MALINRDASIASLDCPSCFRAFLLPFRAAGFVPPCIGHHRFPFTAGDWHAVPDRGRRCGRNWRLSDPTFASTPLPSSHQLQSIPLGRRSPCRSQAEAA